MNCPNCGADTTGQFCQNCGAQVAPAQAPPPPPPIQPPYQQQPYQQPQYQPPYQAPPPPQKKSGGCVKIGLILVAAVVGLILVIGIVGAMTSGNSEATPSQAVSQSKADDYSREDDKPATNASNVQDSSIIRVGETTTLNGVEVNFIEVYESTGGDFNTPTEGNVFILFELEITNNTDKELTVSSLMSFDGYCDNYALNASMGASLAWDGTQLDGTIAPGKKLRGAIGYEVPEDWAVVEAVFEPDVWRGEKITCIIER